jgi:hypothetical protein
MHKRKWHFIVGAAIAAGFIYTQANAEDPARAFIDRVSGKPFTTERTGVSSAKIETNPAQEFIDRVSGAGQLVAERAGPGTTSITSDTTQEFIDRVSAARPFIVQRSESQPGAPGAR